MSDTHDDLCVWWDNVGKEPHDYSCTCGYFHSECMRLSRELAAAKRELDHRCFCKLSEDQKSVIDACDYHRAMQSSIAAANRWQPIETAPKDELICIWLKLADGAGVMWSHCYYDQITAQWRTSRPSGHLSWTPARAVTHWMPIPVPPEVTPI